ncbi:hypothetical protein LIER_29242 [Lithospermum erythrorhizon]|uniref:C2H2-type domain-containing protein n=1 Tax=Lithospermum erythrorhizon TaxID=34254 RepID=A0AAV3RK56_LITER
MKDLKSSSDEAYHNQELELPCGFPSWPPRSYTCIFCKKDFRSAQSLGGHMNIHRRDRAKLRQYFPLREAMSSSCCSTSTTRFKRWHKSVEMGKKKATIHQDLGTLKHKNGSSSVATNTTKNVEIDALDLQLGLQKEDLDLELRLGYT